MRYGNECRFQNIYSNVEIMGVDPLRTMGLYFLVFSVEDGKIVLTVTCKSFLLPISFSISVARIFIGLSPFPTRFHSESLRETYVNRTYNTTHCTLQIFLRSIARLEKGSKRNSHGEKQNFWVGWVARTIHATRKVEWKETRG